MPMPAAGVAQPLSGLPSVMMPGPLSVMTPGPFFYAVVLLVVVPVVGLLKGSVAAAATLPYVYREGGWLFAREVEGGPPAPAPLKHLVAGAVLGVAGVFLLIGVMAAALTAGGALVDAVGLPAVSVLAQVLAAGLLGVAVMFVHRTDHAGRLWRGAVGDPSPATARHLGVYLLALVGVDVAVTVVMTLV